MSKMPEFEAMKALFARWNETGVPKGITYPKSQSDAVGWSCKEFGIKGIGSRREFRTTHETYGPIVKEIKELIAGLKPETAVYKPNPKVEAATNPARKKRTYKTQKARRRAAEVKQAEYQVILESELKKHQEDREELSAARRDLIVEQQLSERLRGEVAKLEAEVARLKQMLVGRGSVLQLVD
ncbi:hypothetical protein AU381_22970 [Sinorhizobium glycinis]|uniref:Uncharacterized protein n=1 Tax=Sinorhizobium glycinis TaxID=1472378 RepID=A0A178XUI9_9HYPH|nr:hypothetical protein [Sinorhizobium glycinis]OAP38432.1 hypothetical protein AU381_22970 [Sinorhizobium glycinis]